MEVSGIFSNLPAGIFYSMMALTPELENYNSFVILYQSNNIRTMHLRIMGACVAGIHMLCSLGMNRSVW